MIELRHTRQPPPGTKINFRDPRAAGLLAGFALGSFLDVVPNARSSSSKYTAPSAGTGIHGYGLVNTTGNGIVRNTAISLPANRDYTCLFVVDAIAWNGTNPGVWRDNTNFCIFQTTTGRPWIRSNAVDVLKPASGYGLTTGAGHVFAFRNRASASASFFADGALRHDATHSTATIASSLTTIGFNTSTAESITGVWPLGLFWDRGLSDGELIALTANPWQLFEFMPLWVKSSAVGTTGTLAKTNANDTLAASGSAVGFTGTLAKTNANDTVAGVGTQTNTGTFARTNADDSLDSVGFLATSGTLDVTNAADLLAAFGTGGGTPFSPGGGGGGGRIGYRPRFQIIYPNVKRGKTLDKKIGEWIEAIVAGEPEAEEPAEVAQVRKVVTPYVREDTIDLAAMQRDAKQVRALLKAYEVEAKRQADEEDDELLMMVL